MVSITNSANERVFQGILLHLINRLLEETSNYSFKKIIQEQNVGVGSARFADGLLYSNKDSSKQILFELKDSNWDATDENLVFDAMQKAFNKGIKYFVTGTPRQLAIYETFKENTSISDRKLKIYNISTIRKNEQVLSSSYEKEILPGLKTFLKDLSDLVHDVKELQWDSIDKYFVRKLSAYILEGSSDMSDVMFDKINSDQAFKKELIEYLKCQDIFQIALRFDREEVYKICQLANYLLYLKLIFYSFLQRDVPALKLKALEIPEQKSELNKALRERFNDVLKHDYELIFTKNILDEFEYRDEYIPALKRNVEQIRLLNFNDLNCDIMGAIYNTLIDNQEQHDRGQHFTNTNEVDIVTSFCLNKNTEYVLDSGCGAGTFLVRAYQYLKQFNKKLSHEQLLEKVWGVEIAPFPAFLSMMNLSLLNIKSEENYPVIIRDDFSELKSTSAPKLLFLNSSNDFDVKDAGGKLKSVKMPVFDACIGNPPYVRQEYIEHKQRWVNLAKSEYGIKKLNEQSDLYVYYLMHTSAFLKEGGRLGYVISSSWLDVSFGTGFQKFLLDHFKIIAVIDNQKVRSFETASVNTVILILEKCNDENEREKNNVKFVRISKEYDELIGSSNDKERFDNLSKFIYRIEKSNKFIKDDDLSITVKNQKKLQEESTVNEVYDNGNWGAKYLRSPLIYNKIIANAEDKLIRLDNICEVKYGIKTGANEFFYVIDETEKTKSLSSDEFYLHFGHRKETSKINWEVNGWYYSEMNNQHYLMERRYFKPLFKSQREASNLDVDVKKLKYHVLICNEIKTELRKYKVKLLKYIEDAEKSTEKYKERPTCKARIKPDGTQDWFNLGDELFVGDFIFPSKVGERFRLIDNRKSKVVCDKVNYNIKVKKKYEDDSEIIFLILNSTLFRFLIDLFSRQMVVKVSDVDVNVVERTLIINPVLLKSKKKELHEIYKELKSREQESIFKDVKKEDRNKLDHIIFEALGINRNLLNELYKETCNYVKDRKEKSESLTTTKTKHIVDYETSLSLAKERFADINIYSEIMKGVPSKEFSIPGTEPKFPKDARTGDSNLFASYNVKFKDGNKETVVNFDNNSQILLFHFFHNELEIKGTKLILPRSPEDCNKILKTLQKDFKKYAMQIKSMLKTYRSKAHYLSIYRDIIFN